LSFIELLLEYTVGLLGIALLY